MQKNKPEISIVLPCRNEEKALPFCLEEIKKTIQEHNLSAEIIVSDSSTDSSPEIAQREGVILVKHDKKGYGTAYLEAFKKIRGMYVFMADADGSYDFTEIPRFIQELQGGSDMIIGNRLGAGMKRNAMPWLNRHVGTPGLSLLLKILYNSPIKDSQSGMRSIRSEALQRLKLNSTGMEFASEMIIKALGHNLKIREIPVSYRPRLGHSKLRPLADGLRHLKIIIFSFFTA